MGEWVSCGRVGEEERVCKRRSGSVSCGKRGSCKGKVNK